MEGQGFGVGIAHRLSLASWIDSGPAEVEFLEVTLERFDAAGIGRLRLLGQAFQLVAQTQRLSLGTPGPLDRTELDWLSSLVAESAPLWVSEHLGFTRTPEVDLGVPHPIPLTREALSTMAEHASEVIEACGRPLLIENIASHIAMDGEMSEPRFLNRLCARAGCGVLLDMTALVINARSHGFDPRAWLRELDLRHVAALRLGGYTEKDGYWEDSPGDPIAEDVWTLAEQVLASAPAKAVILDRRAVFSPMAELGEELARIKAIPLPACDRAGNQPRPSVP